MLTWHEFNKLNKLNQEYAAEKRDARKQIYKCYLINCEKEYMSKPQEVQPPQTLSTAVGTYCLGNCKTSITGWTNQYYLDTSPIKQEKGNNPMRFEQNTAIATVAAVKSDEAIQRDYLLDLLKEMNRYSWREDTKYAELRKMFFIDTPTRPKSFKDLLDAIQAGKYTLNDEKLARAQAIANGEDYPDEDCCDDDGGPHNYWYGVDFTDFPKADRKGYKAAVELYEKEVKNTERKIIVLSPADGLNALLALEAWTPPAGPAN